MQTDGQVLSNNKDSSDEATSKLLHHRTAEALTRLNKVYDITGEGEPDLDDLGEPPAGDDPIAGPSLPPAEKSLEET